MIDTSAIIARQGVAIKVTRPEKGFTDDDGQYRGGLTNELFFIKGVFLRGKALAVFDEGATHNILDAGLLCRDNLLIDGDGQDPDTISYDGNDYRVGNGNKYTNALWSVKGANLYALTLIQ